VQAVLGQEGDIDWTPIRRPSGMRVADRAMDVDKMTPLSGDHPESQVCARAEQQGVRLILSGWGGDEAATFNGRGTGSELLMRGHWRSLLREMKALSRVRGWSLPRAFYVDVVSYLTPAPLVNLAKRMNGKSGGVIDLFPRFLSAQACARLVPDEGLRMAPDGRENRWRLITGAHITERAEVWAMTGARNGLAFAFPLLDRRVVEFALSLPSALFLRGGIRRRAFRDAMADVLPQKVRERHAKYTPFPGGMIDLAEGREEFSARLDAYEKNEAVSRFIDLSHLRRQLATFPSPEQARREMHNNERPKATPQMIAVVRAFRAARYIEIHGSQDHKTPGDGG
jgi:asparagine synthase (glutamine-hydrolysing)